MFPFRIWKMDHNEKCFLKSDGFQRKIENSLNTYLPTHTSVRYSIDLMGKMYVRLYDLSCLCFKSNLRMYLSDILPICVCVCEYLLFSCRFNVRYLVLKVPGWPAERKKNVIHCLWGKTPWKWYKGTVQMKWRRGSETSTPETQLSNV